MKKIILAGILFLFAFMLLINQSTVSAQGMMGFLQSSSDDTAIRSQQAEEQEGKKFLDNLSNKTITCPQLTDTDFEKIGEYFMGQSISNTQRHISMNGMMKRMMGEKGEEQAHTAMGKRLSGCDASAAFPPQDAGFLPMMGMLGMMGNNNQWGGSGGGMMGFGNWNNMMGNTWGIFGGLTWLFIIIFLILGIIYFWKGINKPGR